MKGRDYINYLIENDLLDEEIITRNHILGYISEDEAAVKFGVGTGTVRVWVNQEKLQGVNMNGVVYIPYDSVDPRLSDPDEEEVVNEEMI